MVKRWREGGGRALGYFPVYFPEEIAHALGILPVNLLGASGRVPLDIATAHTQSFVCSISKSVFQLAAEKLLDVFDVLVFSNICDVARNLSGIMKRNFSEKRIEYIHYPIHNTSPNAVEYLRDEYLRILRGLEEVAERSLSAEELRSSIELYNRKRRLLRELMEIRKTKPEAIPYTDYYAALRTGSIMPPERYIDLLSRYIEETKKWEGKQADKVRVVVIGNFCEQPPVMLMKTIEDAGCYIIHDEALVGSYWMGEIITDGADPLLSLARAYCGNRSPLTVRYHPSVNKHEHIISLLKEMNCEGVIFLTPKFCEPALYDYIIYKSALEKAKIPYLHLEYEEATSSFEHARMMTETFAESILF